MTVYEWLKQDPQERDALMKFSYKALLLRQDVPVSVREELRRLGEKKIPATDCNLYFHGQLMYALMETDSPRLKRFQIPSNAWSSELLKRAYCDNRLREIVSRIFFDLQAYAFDLEIPYESVKSLRTGLEEKSINSRMSVQSRTRSHLYTSARITSYFVRAWMYSVCVEAMDGAEPIGSMPDGYMSSDLSRYITRACLVRIYRERGLSGLENLHRYLIDALYMIPQEVREDITTKFNSLNAIVKWHDSHTEAYTQKMLQSSTYKVYKYHTLFERLIKICGFSLPNSNLELIQRGFLHHNCVGSYAARHSQNNMACINAEVPCAATGHAEFAQVVRRIRLIMNESATAELLLTFKDYVCVDVTVRQYKGKFNKDYAHPDNLVRLCKRLRGLRLSQTDTQIEQAETQEEAV